jgi:hypothetical protein
LILRVNIPVVPLIRKMSTVNVTAANRTVRPTRSSDQCNCF